MATLVRSQSLSQVKKIVSNGKEFPVVGKNNFTFKLEKEIGKFDSKAFQQKSLNLLRFLSNPIKSKITYIPKLNLKTTLSTKQTLSPPSTQKACYKSIPLSLSNKLNSNPSDDIKKDQYYSRYNEFSSFRKENAFLKKITTSNEDLILSDRTPIKKCSSSINLGNLKNKKENNKYIKESNINIKGNIIKNSFKKENEFAHFLIMKQIHLKGFLPFNKDYRNIFVILDGTLIVNENIKGFFIDIPTIQNIKQTKINTSELTLLFLKKCTELFKQYNLLSYIFTPSKELLYDIAHIPSNIPYIIVSSHFIFKGIKVLTSPSLIKLYKQEYDNFKEVFFKKSNSVSNIPKRKLKTFKENANYVLEINNTFPGIVKENKCKVFLSEPNEITKQEIQNEINEHCYNKNDFFLYIHNKQADKQINLLKSKIIRKKLINTRKQLKKDYKSFHCDYNKLIKRFTKEYFPNYFSNLTNIQNKQINSKSDLLSLSIKISNLQNPSFQYDKLFLSKRPSHFKPKLSYPSNTFYYALDNKIDSHYPHLMVFNIRNMLSKYKNYDRKNLYQIFVLYKNLMTLCYGLNKNDLILDYGIDFETFYKCVQEISEEKEEFTQKLFMQVDKKKIGLLSLDDFVNGMSFIQNTDLKEKLDLFLKVLDERGKGVLDYEEVKDICMDSIKRNMFDSDSKKKPCEALEELSTFFAKFIFQLVNVDINEPLKLEKIKSAIITGDANEAHYLEMFCGANKIN